MAAKVSALSILHEMLAEAFIEDLRICKEEGIPMAASDKAVIVKFLKDNNITADVDADDMQKLKDEFNDELKAKRAARAASILNSTDEEGDALEGIL